MRESKSKTRSTTNNPDEDNSESLQTELEIIALKAKNTDLIKAHTKLMQDNAEMKNQIYSLHADLLDTQAKYNNLEMVLKNVEQSMKKATPNLIEVLNLFLQVTNRKNSCHKFSSTDRVPDRGFTPKAKAVTHTVKPHTVNGTVLNLVPTISLTRLNTSNTSQGINEESNYNQSLDYRNSLPSTSTSDVRDENQNENLSSNLDTSEVENPSFVSRRKNTTSLLSDGFLEAEDDIEIDHQSSDESEEEEEEDEPVQRLSPIQEESIRSSGTKRTSLGEVRIYLSRLSNEELQVRRCQDSSFSSTDVNVNDTYLNIETTVIENPENPVSKRLRADIMVFSPHTNSTRKESDDSVFNDLSPTNDRPKISVSAVSAISDAEVSPSTSEANDGDGSISRVNWIPTPSMSAMGDIDTSNTKLEILQELGLTPSPSNRSYNEKQPTNDTNNATECSLVPPTLTPKRCTRSSNKVKNRSHTITDDESPRSSVENQNGKESVIFIDRYKGVSGDRPLTPTILLERLENILPERRLTASSVNIQILAQSDEPTESENQPTRTGAESKSSKAKARSKPQKRSTKRKLKVEEEEEQQNTGTLQKKIREIQIRLSNYIPEPDNGGDASENKNERPKRAARPTTLKDASLKVKLRRMF